MKIIKILIILLIVPFFAYGGDSVTTTTETNQPIGKIEIKKENAFMQRINEDIEKNPSAQSYMFRANVYNNNGEYENALADYEKVLEIDKERSDLVFVKIALVYAEQGKRQETEDYIKKALDISKDISFLIT
ncbi:MAG: hypothetical protein ACD_79C00988G0002 [uncultured bacterium]|nr:MAG: hypothetical protein ACD_79C00988G0002 [uncultured bacterium]